MEPSLPPIVTSLIRSATIARALPVPFQKYALKHMKCYCFKLDAQRRCRTVTDSKTTSSVRHVRLALHPLKPGHAVNDGEQGMVREGWTAEIFCTARTLDQRTKGRH